MAREALVRVLRVVDASDVEMGEGSVAIATILQVAGEPDEAVTLLLDRDQTRKLLIGLLEFKRQGE